MMNCYSFHLTVQSQKSDETVVVAKAVCACGSSGDERLAHLGVLCHLQGAHQRNPMEGGCCASCCCCEQLGHT